MCGLRQEVVLPDCWTNKGNQAIFAGKLGDFLTSFSLCQNAISSMQLFGYIGFSRKQQKCDDRSKQSIRNNPYVGGKNNIPLTRTMKLLNRKFKTPVKKHQSPSLKNTYKDTELDMRLGIE